MIYFWWIGQIVNMRHELVQLCSETDWDWIYREIAALYGEREPLGGSGLLALKHTFGPPDEAHVLGL
jgi:hypothetical protein